MHPSNTTNAPLHSHKELIVWQKSVSFVESIYSLTRSFPKEEQFGLVSQMRRAAVSVPSNIAEGRARGTRKDFVHFLRISFASCAELETQLEISKRLSFGKEEEYTTTDTLLLEIRKMLSVMIRKMQPFNKASEAEEATEAHT
ncbi:four helix bundle protein [Candidatus Wolfebacteria bacterium]|nr:MAG: four helix bundle protein [Candidatus Wolfebacteria bacterium]